jgi:hypothetical protein
MNIKLLSLYNKYWPSLFSASLFGVTYYFTPKSKTAERIPILTSNICTDDDEWNMECTQVEYKQMPKETDYWGYITHIPLTLAGTFVAFTMSSNLLFGRRPDNDWKHNPPYNILMQRAGKVIPGALGAITWVGTSIATTIFGERAKATNHIASVGVSALGTLFRVFDIANIKEDDKIDRMILYPDHVEGVYSTVIKNKNGIFFTKGEMPYTEYLAMNIENYILDGVFVVSNTIFIASEYGMTKFFTITDENRNLLKATQTTCARIVDNTLIAIVNEYAFYAEEWAKALGIKNDLVIVKLEASLATQVIKGAHMMATKIQKLFKLNLLKNKVDNAVEELDHAAHGLAEGFKDFGHNVADGFRKIGHNIAEKFKHDDHDKQEDTSSTTSGGSITEFFHQLFHASSCSHGNTNMIFDPNNPDGYIGADGKISDETE